MCLQLCDGLNLVFNSPGGVSAMRATRAGESVGQHSVQKDQQHQHDQRQIRR